MLPGRLVYVLAEPGVIGHLVNRGRDGFEGFDRNDRSVGTFVSLGEAAAAVLALVEGRR
jgi:hypothetical protein